MRLLESHMKLTWYVIYPIVNIRSPRYDCILRYRVPVHNGNVEFLSFFFEILAISNTVHTCIMMLLAIYSCTYQLLLYPVYNISLEITKETKQDPFFLILE